MNRSGYCFFYFRSKPNSYFNGTANFRRKEVVGRPKLPAWGPEGDYQVD